MFGRDAARADYIVEGVLLFWVAFLHALRWLERREQF